MPKLSRADWRFPHAQRRWLGFALALLLLDLITKAWVSEALVYGERNPILPVLDLILLHNPGAAFSFLAGAGGWQRWFFIAIGAIAVAVIWVWMNRLPSKDQLSAAGLSLILGGALGNVIDRVVHGYVVDFLAFHWNFTYFPAFNIADVGITLGAIALIWRSVFPYPESHG